VSSAPLVAFALPRRAGKPSFSADGKKIVYTSWDGHDSEIYTINSNGTGKVQLTNNGTID
jgi:Tol biopolymer transport system component